MHVADFKTFLSAYEQRPDKRDTTVTLKFAITGYNTDIVKVRHSANCSYNVVMGLCTYCKEPTEGVTKYSIELCVHDLRDEREQMWLTGYNDIGSTLFKNASPEFAANYTTKQKDDIMVKYLTPEELICHVLLKPKADDAGE